MEDYELKIANLSNLLSILIISNLSLFIASGLVADFRYFFPIISLAIFLIMELILVFPLSNLKSVKLYYSLFISLLIGGYFLVASIVYMITHGDLDKFST